MNCMWYCRQKQKSFENEFFGSRGVSVVDVAKIGSYHKSSAFKIGIPMGLI